MTSDDAPHIHFHGTDDPLVPFNQSVIYHEALKKAGVQKRSHYLKRRRAQHAENLYAPIRPPFSRPRLLWQGQAHCRPDDLAKLEDIPERKLQHMKVTVAELLHLPHLQPTVSQTEQHMIGWI